MKLTTLRLREVHPVNYVNQLGGLEAFKDARIKKALNQNVGKIQQVTFSECKIVGREVHLNVDFLGSDELI